MNLGDGVLGSALRPETIGTWLEVRLEDGFEHQLQGGLHHSVDGGRDAKTAEFAVRLGDHRLPHRHRRESACLEVISQPTEQLSSTEDDGAWNHSIDTGRACPLVPLDPTPRHDEQRRVVDEVVEVIETTIRIADRPLVQLRLHLVYPQLGLIEVRPQIAGIHQRTPPSALMLRSCWVPSPCDRLSRPRTTTDPPPHPGGVSRRRTFPPTSWLLVGEGTAGMVPTFTADRSTKEAPSYAPATSPRLRRRHSAWPPRRRSVSAPRVPRPTAAGAHRSPAHIHQVRAGGRIEEPSDAGFSRTPFRLACRTRTVWQCRSVPSLSGLLPPSPATPGSGCPQLLPECCDIPAAVPFHHRTVEQRLVAHEIALPVTGHGSIFDLGRSLAD